MKKNYYYTYKITCTEGSFKDKVYYGQHTTDNLNDNYIGSGKKLLKYLKKHPNGYIKEIISFYNTPEELNQAEYELIHPHLGQSYCLNLTEGGGMRAFPGELHPMYGKHHSEKSKQKLSDFFKGKSYITDEGRKKISNTHKGKPKSLEQRQKTSNSLKGHKISDETKQKISEACKGNVPPNKGKKMSEEQKQKLSNSAKGKHRVYDNPEHTKWHLEY